MLKKLLCVLSVFLFVMGTNLKAQNLLSVPFEQSQKVSSGLCASVLQVTPKDSERWVGYWSGNVDKHLSQVGMQQVPMQYDAAITYPAGASLMENKTIEGVRFVLATSPYIKNLQVWISTQLPASASAANICCQRVDQTNEVNELRFDKPYKVDATKPVYVGISFEVVGGDGDNENFPLVFSTEKSAPNAFLAKVGGKGQKWMDFYSQGFGVLALQLLVSGEMKSEDVSMLPDLSEVVSLKEGCMIPLVMENLGENGVEKLAVAVNVGEVQTLQEIVLPKKVEILGEQFFVEVAADVPQLPAIYDYSVKVLEVNGKVLANEVAGKGEICVISDSVNHKVLVEEFTGMWCGHCPRGMVGLEKLRQVHGDNVVLIAAHSNDALECRDYTEFIAQTVAGFPAAHVDRTYMGVDPYYGLGNSFGINDCVETLAQILPVASVTAVPVLKGDSLTATAEVKFLYSGDASRYAVGYVVTEDGMKRGTWMQSNYLSGDESLLAEDPLFKPWVEAGSRRAGVAFNEVAIAAKGIENGVEGSVPETVEEGKVVQHSVIFDLERYRKIQDNSRLQLGVVLFDRKTGKVVNADMKPLRMDATGVSGVELDGRKSVVVARYTLDGRRIEAPQKGLNLLRYSDGSVKKVLVK